MNKATIYGLYNSEKPEEIRYVGKTSRTLYSRLAQHKSDAKLKPDHNKKKSNWINKVLREGGKVRIKCLMISEDYTVDEPIIIKTLLEEGHRLTNIAPGGESTRPADWRPSPESIAKQLATKLKNGTNTKPEQGNFGKLTIITPEIVAKRQATKEQKAKDDPDYYKKVAEKAKATKDAKGYINKGSTRGCIVDGVEYESLQAAFTALGLTRNVFNDRVRKGLLVCIKL